MDSNGNKECNSKKRVLSVLTAIAQKNADVLCKGFLYEPKVPKILRKH